MRNNEDRFSSTETSTNDMPLSPSNTTISTKQSPNDECDDGITPTPTTPHTTRNMLKNVFLLSGMWGLGLGASYVQIPSAQNMLLYTGHDAISSVPLGLIILLSAPCAVCIPKLISRYGDKKIFACAAVLGLTGSLVQMTGVLVSNKNGGNAVDIALLMIGAAMQSFTFASTNNIRFAVAYFSTPEFLPKATALVVLGGGFGALVGPKLSNYTRVIFDDALYAGNFLQIAIMYLLYGILALLADFAPPPPAAKLVSIKKESNDKLDHDDDDDHEHEQRIVSVEEGSATAMGDESTKNDDDESSSKTTMTTERSLREILMTTDLALLIVCQSLSYNIMALYMGIIQLPMNALGYTDNQGTNAIFAHMLGMFLPSIFSGHLIGWLGTWPSTALGFAIFLLGGGLFYINDSALMFTIGIMVVGIGWNISFVGPSAEVSKAYRKDAEKSKVQGLNDGIMLLSIGILQLSASAIYDATGKDWYLFDAILMGVTGFAILIVFIKAFKSLSL